MLSREFWDGIKKKLLDGEIDISAGQAAWAMEAHGVRLIDFYRSLSKES